MRRLKLLTSSATPFRTQGLSDAVTSYSLWSTAKNLIFGYARCECSLRSIPVSVTALRMVPLGLWRWNKLGLRWWPLFNVRRWRTVRRFIPREEGAVMESLWVLTFIIPLLFLKDCCTFDTNAEYSSKSISPFFYSLWVEEAAICEVSSYLWFKLVHNINAQDWIMAFSIGHIIA